MPEACALLRLPTGADNRSRDGDMADHTTSATERRTGRDGWLREFVLIAVTVLVLFLTLRGNFLLFHTVAELFSIVVATATFVIAWNTRHVNQSQFLAFIGLSFPSV